MREVSVKLKNKNGEDVIYEGVSTISLDGEDGTKKSFAFGDLTTGLITLDFTQGDQEVSAPDDELYDKVKVLKPATFLAENIAQGVVIAGIEGTFEGRREMATLNTPGISRSSNTITLSNPSTNGNFNQRFKVYQYGAEQPDFSLTSTSFSLTGKYAAEHDYKIVATCHSNLMNESARSSAIEFSIYSVQKQLGQHLSTTDTTSKISNGLPYNITISSAWGYWLPETIQVYVKPNGSNEYVLTDDYVYSMYAGTIDITAINYNIKIVAEADEEPIIQRPTFSISENGLTLTTDFPRYSEHLLFYDGDTLVHTESLPVNPITYTVTHDTVYYYQLAEDGYYQPNNCSRSSTYAIARINLVNTGPENAVTLQWMQYSEQNYDYGMVGAIDTALSRSIDIDSNLTLNAYGRTVTSEPASLVLSVPTGSHFYEVKYRKDGSVNNGWDMFKFKVNIEQGVGKISADTIWDKEDYRIGLSNADYQMKKSANVTHHIYVDDVLIVETKEGI